MDVAKNKETAEFVARFAETGQVLMGSLPAACCCGGGKGDLVRFKATLGDFKMSKTTPLELAVPRHLPDGVEIVERPLEGTIGKEMVLVEADGREWKPRLRVTQSRDAGDTYDVYAGQYDDGCGHVVDLLVWTDPVPPIVVFGLGAAAICGLIALIDKWTSDCSQELATTVAACVDRGGIPVFHGYVTVGFNPFESSFGCSFQCIWDRCDFPPAGAQVLGPSATTTTTTTTTHPDGTTSTTTTTTTGVRTASTPAAGLGQQPVKTCASEYPMVIECKDFGRPGDRFDTFEALEQAVRRGARLPANAKLDVDKQPQNAEGPCPGQGSHWDFRHKGRHVGSGFDCPCCTDTPTGPVGARKYLYNG
ncbi:hypothetical protein [Chitinimonas koreensis]|uniref:hypothetical protein n=1 Tax=Chitinimonas koreensis TaxID=356302 RepID=UPI0012F86095|nr:hypothetical protein [Chitinimonas koreensis]QNM98640.1 hypothetical protein H9L41_10710 [Chitinimonas koreensis]